MTDAATPAANDTPRASPASPFRFVTTWRNMAADDAVRVRDFWHQHHAIANAADADRRLAQVAMIAIDADGGVAGVSTALPLLSPRIGQPMYYFRAFVAPAWRTSKLVRDITNRSCAALEAFARERGFPCIGVLLELENEGFYRALRKPVWWNPRFYYAGRSERGLELRVFYFEGARLKSAEEVRRIRLPAHP
ncbi:MAG: hypothetical protein JSR26_12525 [Proteobacteria bacterium]|nr:hypothetical protein [Pseudomonadota bacterium]